MRFRLRGFVSLLLAPAFVLVTVSGLVLYAGPSGRTARWSDWSFLGASKGNWSDLHITVSVLLLIVAFLHWWMNWRMFWRHIKRKAAGLRFRLEGVAAAAVLGIVVAGTLLNVPPFSSTLQLSKYIKQHYWNQQLPSPPIAKEAHAEDVELEDIAEAMGLDVEEVVVTLDEAGIVVVDAEVTIGEIANRHGMAPAEVFAVIEKKHPEAAAAFVEQDDD